MKTINLEPLFNELFNGDEYMQLRADFIDKYILDYIELCAERLEHILTPHSKEGKKCLERACRHEQALLAKRVQAQTYRDELRARYAPELREDDNNIVLRIMKLFFADIDRYLEHYNVEQFSESGEMSFLDKLRRDSFTVYYWEPNQDSHKSYGHIAGMIRFENTALADSDKGHYISFARGGDFAFIDSYAEDEQAMLGHSYDKLQRLHVLNLPCMLHVYFKNRMRDLHSYERFGLVKSCYTFSVASFRETKYYNHDTLSYNMFHTDNCTGYIDHLLHQGGVHRLNPPRCHPTWSQSCAAFSVSFLLLLGAANEGNRAVVKALALVGFVICWTYFTVSVCAAYVRGARGRGGVKVPKTLFAAIENTVEPETQILERAANVTETEVSQLLHQDGGLEFMPMLAYAGDDA